MALQNIGTVQSVSQALMAAAASYDFEVLCYCFMPEHMHCLVEGLTSQADLKKFNQSFRIRTKRGTGTLGRERFWQRNLNDRVLRRTDDTAAVCRYIVLNPVRKGYVEDPMKWPHWNTKWGRVDFLGTERL